MKISAFLDWMTGHVETIEAYIMNHKWWFLCGVCYLAGHFHLISRLAKALELLRYLDV